MLLRGGVVSINRINALYKQREITKDNFFSVRDDGGSHRKIFSDSSGLQLNKDNPTFSVAFGESVVPIFSEMTGVNLEYSNQYNNFWAYVNEEEVKKIKEWVCKQGHRVFLRDMLFLSIALGVNKNERQELTEEGKVFNVLKYDNGKAKNKGELQWVKDQFCVAIKSLPFYCDCKYICAVPPRPGKEFDLPSLLVREISSSLSLVDVTSNFTYRGNKHDIKKTYRDAKWDALEAANLTFAKKVLDADYMGKDIIIIDDLYQSGVTVNFVAMKLQQVGFNRICGLYLVKSMNDRDNTSHYNGN